jgi:hypothetical protein
MEEMRTSDVMAGETKMAGRPRLLMVAGVAVVVVILAGAAFVGARLLRAEQVQQGPIPGGREMVAEINDGAGGARQVRISVVPAKELPQAESTLEGVFSKRQDDSIFLGTGESEVMVTKEDDGTGSKKASFNGPVIEVVVTRDTQIWQDDTEMFPTDRPVSGDEFRIQQVVSPGSLDELNENTTVNVWGERRGDRVIATALVYRN